MVDVVPADARLVAADPAIRGLREVLSPLGLVQRLAPGWGVSAARVAYLRYKPGTSLLAGLVLTDDDGATSFAKALALGEGAPAKLAKVARAGEADDAGRGAVVDARAGVALADVTADRHLPGVRHVLRDAGATVSPLVYKPGRRWVARLERDGEPALLVKAHRPATLPGLLAGYRALAGLPVTSVASVRQRHGTITHPWVPGLPLDRVTGPRVPELWSDAGSVLAEVHRQLPAAGLTQVDRGAQLAAAVDAVRAVMPPDVTARAGNAAERVRAGLGGSGTVGVVHGDFSADQVIVRPDASSDAAASAVTVVDLDRVGLDDPLADLACWYGALVATGAGAGEPVEVLAPLLDGYAAAGGGVDLSRLRMHCALAVLQRATEPFRRHVPDWPEQVTRLVAVAEELTA